MSLIIFKEKHGDRYFNFTTEKELHLIARFIIRERHEDGWYEGTKKNILLAMALEGDGASALRFLHDHDRTDYEYESLEIVEPETVMQEEI